MAATRLTPESRLPALREDLQLLEGARRPDGSAGWLVFDPVRHRYFEIDRKSELMLRHWRAHSVGDLLASVGPDTELSLDAVDALLRFLFANSLTEAPPDGDFRNYAVQANAAKRSLLKSALHNYLFIRIPLARPHAFLKRTQRLTAPFFTAQWWAFIGVVAAAGLYLASRQWDQFVHTFLYFFNLQGLAFYFLALGAVKIAHELGHAYAATRYGCRVTTMGVAFLVMFPVLYTDTTDSWKLASRRKRLAITGAGVAVELMIAAVATFLWAFLDDGPARSAAFFLATVSWTMSLAVNLNPLMRFDAYYFLSDAIGVQNLQARSFALGRWALREALFGFGDPPPEAMGGRRRAGLIAFAWAAWVYRFFLFVGIALLIHHFFFKPLGAALLVVELGWFIGAPVINEMNEWLGRADAMRLNPRTLRAGAFAAIALALTALPWRTDVRIPAVLEASGHISLYVHRPAIVAARHAASGDTVSTGDILFELRSPALEFDIAQTRRRIGAVRARLSRIAADAGDRGQTIVLGRELQSLQSRLAGLGKERALLTVRAPFDGVIVDMKSTLAPGRWAHDGSPLADIVSTEGARIRGLVRADDVSRIRPGARAVFVPDLIERAKVPGAIAAIDGANAPVVAMPALASRYGGPVAVSEVAQSLTPLGAWYPVTMTIDGVAAAPTQTVRGEIRARGEAESAAVKIWRRIVHVLIRESAL